MILSNSDLQKFSTAAPYFDVGLQEAIDSYDISTLIRLQYFMAQVAYESGGFLCTQENLDYSTDRLLEVFPSYFTSDNAQSYAHNPEMIANRIYAYRMGNGDEASGDGWKYRGRGLIQITGHDNYVAIDPILGLDGQLVENPDLLLSHVAKSAGAFFQLNNLNQYADNANFIGLTKAINGGLNGLPGRQDWLKKAQLIWPS